MYLYVLSIYTCVIIYFATKLFINLTLVSCEQNKFNYCFECYLAYVCFQYMNQINV